MRIDPAPSEPCAIGSIPAATAAPDPPLEPPAVWVGLQGLRVGGWMSGSVTGMAPSSLVESLPRITKPARRSGRTLASSQGSTIAGMPREPKRVRVKRTTFRSLMPIGTPWNGGRLSRWRSRSRSFRRAPFTASSKTVTKAESDGFIASIRARWWRTSSSLEIAPSRTSLARTRAGSVWSDEVAIGVGLSGHRSRRGGTGARVAQGSRREKIVQAMAR